jgi:hypothetical protein
MIFFAKKSEARTDRRDDAERANRVYVEPSPCLIMPAIDLSALIPARYAAPRTIVDYLT